MTTGATLAEGWPRVAELAGDLIDASGSWAPTLTADGRRVAFVSDRSGAPELYVQDVAGGEATAISVGADPVLAVHWSPDGQWLACALATDGGVRTEVWVVRPDGGNARRVAGPGHPGIAGGHAILGPWAREGHRLVVTVCDEDAARPHRCLAIDPATGTPEVVARGELIVMLDLSADGRFALLRDGTRGAQFCRLVDRAADVDRDVLPYPETGSTEIGLLRPSPADVGRDAGPDAAGSTDDDAVAMVAYLVTDAGLPRRELIAIGVRADGTRVAAGSVAARADAELEFADADAAGTRVLLVWNVFGRSEVELLDTATGTRTACAGLPGDVVSGVAMARDGRSAALAVEGFDRPRRLWRLDCASGDWTAITDAPPDLGRLVRPELVTFEGHDGMPLSGWLYRAQPNADPSLTGIRTRPSYRAVLPPAMISLHGGPEAQERPVFTPQHQVMAAAGITVFAPNIRGSSGFGRAFVHADDRWGRFDAIRDVADCARILAERGWADPARIAVTGRSYGGYATLLALTRHAPAFAAGVDICGMSDLLTFYRDSEAWIAAAAVTKYGDPRTDGALLAEVSPLHQAHAITVPLLVVHGELDTNVPLNEATQLVARLRELGRPVEYLELAGEGHEYRRADSRLLLLRTLTEFLTRTLRAD